MMDQQQAGMTMIVFSPRALRTNRMAMAAPQPGQPTWPGYMNSRSVSSISMTHLLQADPDALPLGDSAVFRLPVDLFEDLRRHVPAAEPGDVAEDGRVAGALHRAARTSWAKMPLAPKEKFRSMTAIFFAPLRALRISSTGKGRKSLILRIPTFSPRPLQLLQHEPGGAGDRSGGDEDDLGVVAGDGLHGPVAAAEDPLVIVFDPGEIRQGLSMAAAMSWRISM